MHSTIDRSLQYILWLPVLLPVSPLFCCYTICFHAVAVFGLNKFLYSVNLSKTALMKSACLTVWIWNAFQHTVCLSQHLCVCEITSTCYTCNCYLLQLTTTQLQASMIAIMDMYMSSSLLQHWNISICHLMTSLLRLVEELGKWPTFCGKWQVPVKDICLASVD